MLTLDLGEQGSTESRPTIGQAARVVDRNADIRKCMQHMRAELVATTQRHEEQLVRSMERHLAIQSAGWRSAPSEAKRTLGRSTSKGSIGLPPPPTPGTPVRPAAPPRALAFGAEDTQQLLAVDVDACDSELGDAPGKNQHRSLRFRAATVDIDDCDSELAEAPGKVAPAPSPRSVSSTRTGSNSQGSNTQSIPEEVAKEKAFGSETGPCLPGAWAAPLPPGTTLTSRRPSGASAASKASSCGQPHLKRLDSQWAAPADGMLSYPAEIPTLPSEEGSILDSKGSKGSSLPSFGGRWATPTGLFSRAPKRVTPSQSLAYSSLPRRQSLFESKHSATILTKTPSYESLSAIFIIMNAIFIIWETEIRALTANQQDGATTGHVDVFYFNMASNAFCMIFVLDLLLRILLERWLFLHSSEWGWNVFDIFVCFTAAVEMLVQWYALFQKSDDSGLSKFLRKFSMLRILRLLRVIRVARSMRCIRFIRDLRLMVFSLTSSLRSLAWSVVLIGIILMVFGVCFTDGVIAHCLHENTFNDDSTKDMRMYFGDVPTSAVSLFMAMTGGEDWGAIFKSLAPLPWEYTLLFLVFVTFAVLALLNLVTAVFINAAMQRSMNDRELAVQQELESKEELSAILQTVFLELDTGGTGSLSAKEFENHIEDDKIMAYLRSRQIEIGQVRTLFTLLDKDQTGDVSMEEFVEGIIRFKGGATSMDLAVLAYQVEYIQQMLTSVLSLMQVDEEACHVECQEAD